MNENEFRKFLKRAGKKDHVVNELVGQVQLFEGYLESYWQMGIEASTEVQLRAYLGNVPEADVKNRMRSLALYFAFSGNAALAKLAGRIREQGIAKTRKAFKLREFRGVKPEDAACLEERGIVTVEDMLAAGQTPEARRQLAEQSGIAPQVILELVKLSDLSRLGAIKSVRARLYYDAGLDTPAQFTRWETEALRQMLVAWVERTGFPGIAPLPKEIHNAIEAARSLPIMVIYDEEL